jgi:hypothetical protein
MSCAALRTVSFGVHVGDHRVFGAEQVAEFQAAGDRLFAEERAGQAVGKVAGDSCVTLPVCPVQGVLVAAAEVPAFLPAAGAHEHVGGDVLRAQEQV